MVNCHGSRVPHSRASNSINQIQSTRLFPLLIPLLPFVRRVPTVLRDTSPRYSDLQLWVKAGSNANSLPPAGSPSMFFSTVHISPCLPTAGTVRSVRPHFHQLILIFFPKGNQPQVGWSQHLEIFRLDISWRWSCACLRWRSYPPPHVAQYYPCYPPKACLVVSRR